MFNQFYHVVKQGWSNWAELGVEILILTTFYLPPLSLKERVVKMVKLIESPVGGPGAGDTAKLEKS